MIVLMFHGQNEVRMSHADTKSFTTGTEQGKVSLWSSTGEQLGSSWHPHETGPAAAVQIHGDLVLSAGDIVCIYNRKARTWQRAAWNVAAITDVEWMSRDKFVAADFNGDITLDTVEERAFMPVR